MVQPPKTNKISAPDPDAQIKDEIRKADLGIATISIDCLEGEPQPGALQVFLNYHIKTPCSNTHTSLMHEVA